MNYYADGQSYYGTATRGDNGRQRHYYDETDRNTAPKNCYEDGVRDAKIEPRDDSDTTTTPSSATGKQSSERQRNYDDARVRQREMETEDDNGTRGDDGDVYCSRKTLSDFGNGVRSMRT